MRPVLFAWRGIRIWSYPACLFLGVNVGVVAQNWAANAVGANAWRVYVATLVLLPVALVGSRLLFLVGRWRYYVEHPGRIWRRTDGGMSMLGGVPIMVAVSIPLLGALHLPFWVFWDLSIFCILAGMACTRVGCLLNGCCAGRETGHSWSLYLPNCRGVWARRYPTQLLEGAVALLLLGVAATVYRGLAHRQGILFLIVIGAYGLARFGLESLREERDRLGPFDLQHVMASGLVAFSVIGLVLLIR